MSFVIKEVLCNFEEAVVALSWDFWLVFRKWAPEARPVSNWPTHHVADLCTQRVLERGWGARKRKKRNWKYCGWYVVEETRLMHWYQGGCRERAGRDQGSSGGSPVGPLQLCSSGFNTGCPVSIWPPLPFNKGPFSIWSLYRSVLEIKGAFVFEEMHLCDPQKSFERLFLREYPFCRRWWKETAKRQQGNFWR